MANPKLSKPSKMPCQSWSLQAIDTCPGSKGPDGNLVPACAGCYATTGNYRFKNVVSVREHNRQDWQSPNWVESMIAAIGDDEYFRWFDSGDCYSLKLAEKILLVMIGTPNTRHWFPTRMHKFAKFEDVLTRMADLENVVVRFSSDGIFGETIEGKNTSTIVQDLKEIPDDSTVCDAYNRQGKCGDCRACWDGDIKVIVYPAHGVRMNKVARELSIRIAA